MASLQNNKKRLMKKSKLLLVLSFILFALTGCKTSQTVVVKNETAQVSDDSLKQEIPLTFVSVDKNGNIDLSITATELFNSGYAYGDLIKLEYNGKVYEAPIVSKYSDVNPDEYLIRVYDDIVEFAINYNNCFDEIGASLNDACALSMSKKSGYAVEYKMRYLETSLDREDYLTDSQFANFREIDDGHIKENVLFRSASLTAFNARSPYATELAKKNGIVSIINLDDNDETLKRDLGFMPNDWYEALYNEGHVALIDLNTDYRSDGFKEKIAEAMRFISNNEGPYLIQGSTGITRTGFFCVILESLLNANQEQIEADYMKTYENLYGLKKGTTQYNYAKKIPYEMLASIADGVQLKNENLGKVANNYLLDIGLTDCEIVNIIKNLAL
ncbi:MAG: tyrosine-protein phosphatase [Sphaerochaetaceae bacterium]|nr:tyrosine-protein phosphatase [Sphaerochaetaceae bacterium]